MSVEGKNGSGSDEPDEDRDEEELEPATGAEAAAEVLTSKTFWTAFGPRLDRWISAYETKGGGIFKMSLAYLGLRFAFVVGLMALVWAEKIPKDAALTIIGGIAGALFTQRAER